MSAVEEPTSGSEPARSSTSAGRRSASYSDLREPVAMAEPIAPRRGPIWLRPFGYLLATVLWTAMWLVSLLITVIVIPVAFAGPSQDDGGLMNTPAFQGTNWIPGLIVIVLLMLPLFGWMTILICCWTAGTALSGATLFARSLSPRYADESLSFSSFSRGEVAGPASTAFTGVSLSLLPVRMTRWSKLVTILRFNGQIPNGNQFILGFGWELFYLWTVGWLVWPAAGIGVPICSAVSVLLFAGLLWLVWRRRHKYAEVMPDAFTRTPYAHSWPNRPTSKKTPAKKSASKTRSATSAKKKP